MKDIQKMVDLRDKLIKYLTKSYAGSTRGRRVVIDRALQNAFLIGWDAGIEVYKASRK